MSKFVKVEAENCLPCYFYDTCFLDGIGTPTAEKCEIGKVWKYQKDEPVNKKQND